MNKPATILITGASGLVGRPLCRHLASAGYRIRTLSHGPGGDFQWDPMSWQLPDDALVGVEAIIHLAGENVAQRWSDAAKQRILESRVKGTELLVERVLASGLRPDFIAASGINYYGFDRSDPVDESSASGDGFLAEVCRAWEAAARPLEAAGCRSVFLRTGIVLSPEGGALAKMLPPFKAGLGGRIGSGRQMMSWVDLEDLVRIYVFCLENASIRGPVNAVAPAPVANMEFTKALGKVIGRPTFFPLPAAVVRSVFGEMGRETVLSDLAVLPQSLQKQSFEWRFPELEQALKNQLQS